MDIGDQEKPLLRYNDEVEGWGRSVHVKRD